MRRYPLQSSLHQRGCHGLLLSLCCNASTIPGLQAHSNCSCVCVISQQIQPSFQPKDLFLGAFSLQALSGQSVLGCSAYEMPWTHFPLVNALLMPRLVKPCVICRKHHGIVGWLRLENASKLVKVQPLIQHQDPTLNRSSCPPQCRRCWKLSKTSSGTWFLAPFPWAWGCFSSLCPLSSLRRSGIEWPVVLGWSVVFSCPSLEELWNISTSSLFLS